MRHTKERKAWRLAKGVVPFCLFTFLPLTTLAQEQKDEATVSGSIQSDMLFPQSDDKIGAVKNGDFNTNTYIDVMMQSRHVDAGGRFEYKEHPLPGYANAPEEGFKGMGMPHFWVKGKLGDNDLTVGTFYEQFGSGFILRSYEERSLGIDNSLLGARIVVRPFKGLTLKALTGWQRHYWTYDGGQVTGVDGEVNLDEWIPALQQHDWRIMLGGSWVNRYEKDEVVDANAAGTQRLHLPKYVNAWDVRLNLNKGPWGALLEYAQKSQDPSLDNGYIYKKGSAALLSTSYSNKGLSILLQAKRSENMAFRSKRTILGNALYINHLPAFTLDHTYALAALYPYATQLATGEWAYQAEVGYNFKRRTWLGGRYGMNVKVNFSYVRAIDNDPAANVKGMDGYKSKFFKWGDDTYYQDLNIQLTRKFSSVFKLNLMYMNQRYNQQAVEKHGESMIKSNIFVADAMFQLAPKTRLRCELQYLQTKQDRGDWVYGLLELSLAPHWMLTVSDMWNCGNSNMNLYTENTHYHYYQGLVTYNIKSHRIQAGYGRTRAGYNCAGGVCRYVPATKGFTISYNYNF